MSKYQLLHDYLSGHSGERAELSLKQIEDIIKAPLPPSARSKKHYAWWANTKEHSQGKAWLEAGWAFEHLDRAEEKVVFLRSLSKRRRSSEPESSVTGAALIARLSPAAKRLIDDCVDIADGDLETALATLIESAALERRKNLMQWFADNSPKGSSSNVDLIREDRDGR